MTLAPPIGSIPALVADDERAVPAILATPVDDPFAPSPGSVRCDVCAHRCVIRVGRTGVCGVRTNRDGRLVSLVHGRAVATAVDPVEKKPLFHVAPGSLAYSIATAGCSFHCTFCQNWEISQGPRLGLPLEARALSADQAVAEAWGSGARSIAYTYIEPTVFLEYVLDVGRAARDAGLLGLYVTNGYATPEAIEQLAPVIDAANVDLKGFDDAVYRRVCGARLAPVLDGLVELRRHGVWVEVTTLVIPGLTDDPAQLRALTGWIVEALGPETPWHVSRFLPAYRMRDRPMTPLTTLVAAADQGRRAGLHHVYVGDAPELDAEDTRCAGCGLLLVARHGYRIERHLADDGSCPRCGRPLEGVALAAMGRRPCG